MLETMTDPSVLALIFVIAAMAIPYSYAIGLAFSRGYHKGKREFLRVALSNSGPAEEG